MSWTEEYKKETNRSKRAEILAREKEAHGAEPAYEIRQKLYEARYGTQGGREVDYFIRGWMTLEFQKRSKFSLSEKQRKKELASVLQDWQFDLCKSYGAEGEAALYDELYNMTCLYIALCRSDRFYNSMILGLGHLSEEKSKDKIMGDVRNMTDNIPERLQAEKELRPFILAARQALADSF